MAPDPRNCTLSSSTATRCSWLGSGGTWCVPGVLRVALRYVEYDIRLDYRQLTSQLYAGTRRLLLYLNSIAGWPPSLVRWAWISLLSRFYSFLDCTERYWINISSILTRDHVNEPARVDLKYRTLHQKFSPGERACWLTDKCSTLARLCKRIAVSWGYSIGQIMY